MAGVAGFRRGGDVFDGVGGVETASAFACVGVFGLMVAMVVLMAWLAVRQNAQIMAQVALIGGMAAPLLTSDGSGNYLVLFSYLALLNGGVAAIAWFKHGVR